MNDECNNSVLDKVRIAELMAVGAPDKHCLFSRLTELFFSQSPQIIAELKMEFANKDDFQIAEKAHKLKSSSGAIGAIQIADYCAKCETEARSMQPNMDIIAELVGKIEEQYPVTVKAIEEISIS